MQQHRKNGRKKQIKAEQQKQQNNKKGIAK